MSERKNLNWVRMYEGEVISHGYRKVRERIFQMPDGKNKGFFIKWEGEVISVFALTTDKKVIMVRQFRPGPEKITLELPCGMIDKDETPADAATRELLEETGYSVGSLTHLGKRYIDPYSTLIQHEFIAQNCQKISEQKLDDSEFIEVITMSIEEFRTFLVSEKCLDATHGFRGLHHLGLL